MMTQGNDFDEVFYAALAKVPETPDCFPGILRRIHRKNLVMRTVWAAAASVLVAAGVFMYAEHAKNLEVPLEVVEELQRIHSHVNGDDVRQEMVSCSLSDDEIY
jgi:hypothetical protein